MSDLVDRVRAVNQRWLATMGLDDESLALHAEIRERAEVMRRDLGPRPPWWRPFARRRFHRRIEGVEARVLQAMLEERLAAVEPTEHPYRQLVAEVPRPPSTCFAVDGVIIHLRVAGGPRCRCGFEDLRPEPTGLPGPGERQSR